MTNIQNYHQQKRNHYKAFRHEVINNFNLFVYRPNFSLNLHLYSCGRKNNKNKFHIHNESSPSFSCLLSKHSSQRIAAEPIIHQNIIWWPHSTQNESHHLSAYGRVSQTEDGIARLRTLYKHKHLSENKTKEAHEVFISLSTYYACHYAPFRLSVCDMQYEQT